MEKYKMKVLFLNPPNTDPESYIARSADRWPHRVERGKLFRRKIFPKYPIYMLYGAAVIEAAGHQVAVIDAAERDYTPEQTYQFVRDFEPHIVVEEISDPSRQSDLNIARQLKELGVHICIIGTHATVFSKNLIQSQPFVDSVARGEFYYSLLEMLEKIEIGESLDDVEGITFRKNGTVVANPDREALQDIDQLPYPARHLLDPQRYLMGHYTYKPQLLMLTSIGCPYSCIYCLWPKILYGGKVRLRSPSAVVKEMRLLMEEYGAREIYFDDDLFNVTEKRIHDVCDAILDEGIRIPWITEMRCDHVSEKSLLKMKKAGCVKILFGVESGVQQILDSSRKKITLDQVRKTFSLSEQVGIKTHATFMFGLPGESRDTIERSIRFAKELNSDTIQCSIALPYPGTEFYDLAQRNGTLKIKDWLDFDGELCGAVEYDGLDKETIRCSVNRMYKEFYTYPKHIVKQIAGIRSLSDLQRLVDLGLSGLRRFT